MNYKNKFYVFSTFIFFICSSAQAQSVISKKLRLQNFIRCTRRYTPGICIEPVASVWTFVFQLQNCTERYGCPAELRSNRFNTYGRCLKLCKPLISLYTEILANDSRNLSAYLRSKSWASSGRREMDFEEDLELDQDIMKIANIEAPAPNPLEDSDNNYRELTPDIDYVDSDVTQEDLMSHLNRN
ncbi:unnamed protein product [Euphydryas editha]|uniref:BPTI/Kunitz inhibitor domain-containing protein n=1 Tax=Euphydryas editha TaxID=104508 RepID=A0AAU9UN30_EUPED|nr:unnamed protein product [Euphydryas editha]